ncbi:uncharacterized protein LAJ45_07238 [Morchella importuna]|uniref:uncharacterized protein n=1 Tax=Morchella importuna TaxID=1174673 RepID=UPI001E8D63E2|nr:uncharacterized protein LAJ45_07238 [Morchella importuna]KAH8148527.1 hypothetical protein LAJ45_07238 [Morchella importuna]
MPKASGKKGRTVYSEKHLEYAVEQVFITANACHEPARQDAGSVYIFDQKFLNTTSLPSLWSPDTIALDMP